MSGLGTAGARLEFWTPKPMCPVQQPSRPAGAYCSWGRRGRGCPLGTSVLLSSRALWSAHSWAQRPLPSTRLITGFEVGV